MPDYSMCDDPYCPSAPRCYRHTASGTKPNPLRQAYTDFQRSDGAEACEDFLGYRIKRNQGKGADTIDILKSFNETVEVTIDDIVKYAESLLKGLC